MIVSLSKKHSKGTEKPMGTIATCPEANIITMPFGLSFKEFVYFNYKKAVIVFATKDYNLQPEFCGHFDTVYHTDLQSESPGTVVTFTQL